MADTHTTPAQARELADKLLDEWNGNGAAKLECSAAAALRSLADQVEALGKAQPPVMGYTQAQLNARIELATAELQRKADRWDVAKPFLSPQTIAAIIKATDNETEKHDA